MKLISHFFLLALTSSVFAQKMPVAAQYAATIDSQDIKDHVYALASPKFEGRETGTSGNKKAALYIADQFSSFAIPTLPGKGGYFQDVAFSKIIWDNIQLTVNEIPVEYLQDFLSIPQYFPASPDPIHIEALTFVGYGIDDPAYSDYRGKNFKGQHLLMFAGEPRDRRGNYKVSGTNMPSAWSEIPMRKIEAAKAAGAASVWIIEDGLKGHVMYAKRELLTGKLLMGSLKTLSAPYIPHAFISTSIGDSMIGDKNKEVEKMLSRINKKGKSGVIQIPVGIDFKPNHFVTSTESVNVLGYIEGTDPNLKDELVILSAHFDHLGKRGNEIFFGADDNASGTSAVLEIAEALAEAKDNGDGPRRSVLCILMTGEEKGLLGSQYYSEYPFFPLRNTVANVNIDMIGRMDTLHRNPNYTYVIGSDRLSTELHQINESMNRQYTHLDLDYTYNSDSDPNRFYYRSDHYNFAKNGIPAIFYFSGVHEDYHRPTDTPDKVMYGKAQTITQLAFYTVWELANRDERIKVNVTGRN